MMKPSEARLFSGLVCEGYDMVSGPQSTAVVLEGKTPSLDT